MAGRGRKVWTNEVLSQPDLQDYLQDQVVMQFDNAAQRTAGVPAPTEGMVSYLRDVNRWDGYTQHPTTGALAWAPLQAVPPQVVTLDATWAQHYADVSGAVGGIARVRVWAQGRTGFMSGMLQTKALIGALVEQTIGTVPAGLAPVGREVFLGMGGATVGQRFDVYPAGGTADRAIKIVAGAGGLAAGTNIGMAATWSLD